MGLMHFRMNDYRSYEVIMKTLTWTSLVVSLYIGPNCSDEMMRVSDCATISSGVSRKWAAMDCIQISQVRSKGSQSVVK